ncbi:uncharacterized protein BX663DRAFT_514992 [Cokeromyces recurvatus]|uniref:uncharacterized protein n=1 Tax=Cokeromyces recurvatus TaxID=90255 RepID=UPI00221F4F2D|nr:uncharacterized protein BX663DRAFT_514992 [Cokeromyces recurvatus]KAI7901117.1 hypothetical protein BX663DRAFT_514992 [Cokeromyces recurvatus]
MSTKEIQTLYRSFLKVMQKWPVDKVRPKRDLKQIMSNRIEETFRKPLLNKDQLDMTQAKRELAALERLLNNEFKERFPLSEKILSPASNPKYYSRLIASLNANKDGSKSFLAKLLGQ